MYIYMYNFNFLSFHSPNNNMVILAAGTKTLMEGNFISVHFICGFKNMGQIFFFSLPFYTLAPLIWVKLQKCTAEPGN